jgi:hypothetical protein
MDYERLKVHPGCLMVFVDETGHEEFADRNYPVFGFGGCAVPAFVAPDVLERPWREMKECHFGGPDVALHASDLQSPTGEQLEALSAFFRGLPHGGRSNSATLRSSGSAFILGSVKRSSNG